MRNTFYIIIATMMGWCMCVYGQDKKSLLERINSIKSQNDIYYWNQYTWYSADTAKINATSQLLSEVNCYRAENEQLTVEELMPYADYIVIDRGNAKQYFVYIKKADAIAIKKQARFQFLLQIRPNQNLLLPMLLLNVSWKQEILLTCINY